MSTPHPGNPYIGLQQATNGRGTYVQIWMDTKIKMYKQKNMQDIPRCSIQKEESR